MENQNLPKLLAAKWTKREIEILKINGPNYSRDQLIDLIPKHTSTAISSKCKRLNIHKSKEFKSSQAKNARANVKRIYTILDWKKSFEDLNFETKQIIIGSLLGDGFVTLNASKSKEYCFRIGHGKAQKQYLLWKCDLLEELAPKLSGLEMFTPLHPIFTKLRESFYKNAKRKCNLINEFVPMIDWLGFLIWYLDDGSLQSRERDITITSKLFDNDQIEQTINLINEKLGLHLTFKSYRHLNGIMKRIRVPQIDRKKVHEKFKELFNKYHIPSTMGYKINIRPIKIETHNPWKKNEIITWGAKKNGFS